MMIISSCNNVQDEVCEKQQVNMVKTELITNSSLTKGGVDADNYPTGFLCTSETSNLKAEIYLNEENNQSNSLILDKYGKVAYFLHFEIDSYQSETTCIFTAYNELQEPIMSGIFDVELQKIEITHVYGNDVVTRASAATWGCGLAMGIAGGIWSTAAGMVSAGAGFIVGLSYTAMAIAMCDRL